MSQTYNRGAVVTIRRPDGNVEEVINTTHSSNGVIPAKVFAAMVKATKDAGRGDILSQRPNVVVVPESVELAAKRMSIVGKLDDLSAEFPSATKAAAQKALQADLAAFDAAHPEIVAAAKAAAKAERSAAVARALRMED